ncbi:hypothetical protein [Clostridium sp. HMP27]|uniref:hypothetical protein n=1 Tax=Clostridium sp. HMP27 TaxID=1487921 RepID=UPI00068DB38A|nr:hypothetical protein [Clostridium sp. HMP27]
MPNYEKLQWRDQVKDQNGNIIQEGTPLSAKNMNRMEEGIDLADNLLGVLVAEALGKIGGINKELEKWKNQRVQQGIVYIYNKAVVNGCIINAMPNSRYLQISKSGTFTEGSISEIYVDGRPAGLKDEQMIAMVPQNITSTQMLYYVYVDYDGNQKRYRPYLAENVPEGRLVLYKITVPAGDNRMDLSSITITDQRRIETNTTIRNTEPLAIVSFSGLPMLDLSYDVLINVDSASDLTSVGETIVFDKQANGFKIKTTGSADNIKLRWTAINSDIA